MVCQAVSKFDKHDVAQNYRVYQNLNIQVHTAADNKIFNTSSTEINVIKWVLLKITK